MTGERTRLRLLKDGREIARSLRARTLWERFRGLMLMPPLSPGEALWLPACSAVHTAFVCSPLDLLFLKGQRIVRTTCNLSPWRVAACPGADSVIELAAGEVDRLGLAPGQQIDAVSEIVSTDGAK